VAQIGHDGLCAGFDQLTAWVPPTNPIAVIPAAAVALTPAGESSITRHSAGAMPSVRRHAENVRSGFAAGDIAGGEYLLE
jgi:hypothetical protein